MYDPTVQTDLERFLSRLVPEGDPIYQRTLEGADDMPAHVRAALAQTHLAIQVAEGGPLLGTWQGIYRSSTGGLHRREAWCCTCSASRAAVAYSRHSFCESCFASL